MFVYLQPIVKCTFCEMDENEIVKNEFLSLRMVKIL